MIATPIYPGQLYRVRGFGKSQEIAAASAFGALREVYKQETLRRAEA